MYLFLRKARIAQSSQRVPKLIRHRVGMEACRALVLLVGSSGTTIRVRRLNIGVIKTSSWSKIRMPEILCIFGGNHKRTL